MTRTAMIPSLPTYRQYVHPIKSLKSPFSHTQHPVPSSWLMLFRNRLRHKTRLRFLFHSSATGSGCMAWVGPMPYQRHVDPNEEERIIEVIIKYTFEEMLMTLEHLREALYIDRFQVPPSADIPICIRNQATVKALCASLSPPSCWQAQIFSPHSSGSKEICCCKLNLNGQHFATLESRSRTMTLVQVVNQLGWDVIYAIQGLRCIYSSSLSSSTSKNG